MGSLCYVADALGATILYLKKQIYILQENGGGTIVENTTKGIKRDMTFLKRVAMETGVNVVAGSGLSSHILLCIFYY